MPEATLATPAGRSRRRGEILERALYEATLAELADAGYGGLTMEGIAARAHTGKAALYRRWGSRQELVHAALVFTLPPLPEPRAGRPARHGGAGHCQSLCQRHPGAWRPAAFFAGLFWRGPV